MSDPKASHLYMMDWNTWGRCWSFPMGRIYSNTLRPSLSTENPSLVVSDSREPCPSADGFWKALQGEVFTHQPKWQQNKPATRTSCKASDVGWDLCGFPPAVARKNLQRTAHHTPKPWLCKCPPSSTSPDHHCQSCPCDFQNTNGTAHCHTEALPPQNQ